MLTVVSAFCASVWPKEIKVVPFKHTSEKAFDEIFSSEIYENAKQVTDFAAKIRTEFLAGQTINEVKACIAGDNACETAVKAGVSAADYYLYNAFVEASLDSIMTFSNQETEQFGYAVGINTNLPFAKKVHEFVQSVMYEIQSTEGQQYSAITLAGFNGFFAIRHLSDKTLVGFTLDLGDVTELPEYNVATFVATINALIGKAGFSQNLVKFCHQYAADAKLHLESFLDKAEFAVAYLYGISATTGKAAKFLATSKTYTRACLDLNTVQTSLRANLNNVNFSDYRIVNMQRIMNSKVESGASLDTFYDALRSYPFRTEFTPVIAALSGEGEKLMLQKCTSIYDSYGICNCADPPAPANWWVISLSIVIMIATILAWVYGCRTAQAHKRAEEIQDLGGAM